MVEVDVFFFVYFFQVYIDILDFLFQRINVFIIEDLRFNGNVIDK